MNKIELEIYQTYILGGEISEGVYITALSNLRCHPHNYQDDDGNFIDAKVFNEVVSNLLILKRYNLVYFGYQYTYPFPNHGEVRDLVKKIIETLKQYERDGSTPRHMRCNCQIPTELVLL